MTTIEEQNMAITQYVDANGGSDRPKKDSLEKLETFWEILVNINDVW